MLPGARQFPVLEHGEQIVAPAALKKPMAQVKPEAAMVPLGASCAILSIYVPTPPLVPAMNDDTVVPAMTPGKKSV